MSMNRVVNQPDLVVDDMLVGWLRSHQGRVAAHATNPRVAQRVQAPEQGKVGVVSGGGSGHEPAFLGYVGNGLLDAVAIGEIFSSPSAKNFLDAIRAANGGAGVACLYGNYAGDNMNVRMAMDMAAREGITVQTVVANDDVPSAPKGDEAHRRGVAGEILMWKVGGAKAALGAPLNEVIAAASKAIANTRSVGVGLSACVIPAVGKANFKIEPGTMEVGIGHHGEPGMKVCSTVSAAEMAQMMLDIVVPDLPFVSGDRVAVLLSGLGATPLMEQYILYGEVAQRLESLGLTVAFNQVGNLFTSLEMMGVTLTLMKLDAELEACLKHPCESVGLTVVGQPASGHIAKHKVAEMRAQFAQSPSVVASHSVTAAAARPLVGDAIALSSAGDLVHDLIETIVRNREYLSEIDGLIGDGDHGINMAKGFVACGQRLSGVGERAAELTVALEQLSQALMDDIGGSMGPLYGRFFDGFVTALEPHQQIDAHLFADALKLAVSNVQAMGNAQVGDKTLMDTLSPALQAYQDALTSGAPFSDCLRAMSEAAEVGMNSTKNLQARLGRSARLGARSIGVLDAGAVSCCLILQSMAASLQNKLPQPVN